MKHIHKTFISYEDLCENLVLHEEDKFFVKTSFNSLIANLPKNVNHINFENVFGLTDQELDEQFFNYYCECLMAYPISERLNMAELWTKLKQIAQTTFKMNGYKYLAGLETFYIEYNPIENYNSTEKEAIGHKLGGTSSSSSPNNYTSTTTLDVPKSTTINYATTYDNYTDDRKVSKTEVELDGTSSQSVTISGSITSSTTPTNDQKSDLADHDVGDTNYEVNDRVLTRSGNIGVTSTQQMLQQEIELKAYDLVQEVFNDLKHNVMLSVY